MKNILKKLFAFTLFTCLTAPALAQEGLLTQESRLTPREKKFHIEPTINFGANGLGEGVYFSFGKEARFKTGIINQVYQRNYTRTTENFDSESHQLSIGYLKIPLLLEINNPSSIQYTQFGVFFATPFSSKLDGQDLNSGLNNLFGFEFETGYTWRFSVVSLKVGIQSLLSFNSATSAKDIPDSNLFQFNVTSGISFSM